MTFFAALIDPLNIDPHRPLVICDADEVLVQFARPLERFLEGRGLWLDLGSFKLSGNVRCLRTNVPLPADEMPALIADFFAEAVEETPLVDGAAEAVEALAGAARLIVLSNVPEAQRARRQAMLEKHGVALPVLANRGPKGPLVRAIAERQRAPVVFIDDLPPNHASVAEHAGAVHRIHFVADPRLAALVAPAEHAHVRIDCWRQCVPHILDHLNGEGR